MKRTLSACERELRELQEHYARLLDEAGAPREDGTMDGDKLAPLRERVTEEAGLPPAVLGTDPLAKRPGLVWREKRVVADQIPTFKGYEPLHATERKPDLNLDALAACAKVERARGGPAGWHERTLRHFAGGWHERRQDGTWAKVTVSRGHDNDPDETIRQAGEATLRERKAKNTFSDALRRLVKGIDVQGEDGTWSIDRDALAHAKRVLGIEEGGDHD